MQNKASPEFFETRIPETRSQCKDLLLESTFAQKKKKEKEKPCKNKCNSIDDQVFFNCALAPTVAVFN